MASIRLKVNGKTHDIKDVDPSTPLLWVLRDTLGFVGTKYGCGAGYCGACTVQIDGEPMRSCSILAADVTSSEITTIEGLAGANGELHPLQKAWIELDVPQCGYCQAGQLLTAAALLKAHPTPTDAEIDEAMAGNLCRCATYIRIKSAIHKAAGTNLAQGGNNEGG